jgi:pyruvate dehydrogenase (quinone)
MQHEFLLGRDPRVAGRLSGEVVSVPPAVRARLGVRRTGCGLWRDIPLRLDVFRARRDAAGPAAVRFWEPPDLGNPEYGVNLASLDFVKFAEAAGARGMHIEDPRTCTEQMREAFSWEGPVIIECLVDTHQPPMPAKVKKHQVTAMLQALREGTPNRNRIAMQMVKDMLDESTFDASPGHVIPGKVGQAVAGLADKIRDHTDSEHPE